MDLEIRNNSDNLNSFGQLDVQIHHGIWSSDLLKYCLVKASIHLKNV